MLRVIYDTNVIVSAVLKNGSIPASLVALAISRKVRLCLSPPILAEYAEVLHRSKFALEPQAVDRLIADISHEAIIVHPTVRLAIAPDEADNRFLECASESEADYLITGNIRHFPQPAYHRTRIMMPANFAKELAEQWPDI
jgi:putative PIN family toxin of toxin-antitoxin system